LAELPPEQRVKKVQELLQAEQARKTGRAAALGELARRERGSGEPPGTLKRPPRRLDPIDMEGLFAWMDQYARNHRKQMFESLPPAHRERVEREFARVTDPVRRQELVGWIWLWWLLDSRGKQPPSISDQELADLRAKLSPATRKKIESRPPAEQWRAVSGLFMSFMLNQYSARHGGTPIHSATEEELASFFEKELTPKQRDDLLRLSAEEMQRTLWKMYVGWKLRQLPPLRPGRDKRQGGAGPWPRPPDATGQPGPPDLPSRGGQRPKIPRDKAMPPSVAPSGRASEEPAAKRPKEPARPTRPEGLGAAP
jgi:hypothetical protein